MIGHSPGSTSQMGAESTKDKREGADSDRTYRLLQCARFSTGRSSERVGKSSLALRYQRHTAPVSRRLLEEYLALGAQGHLRNWRGRTAGPLQGPGSTGLPQAATGRE